MRPKQYGILEVQGFHCCGKWGDITQVLPKMDHMAPYFS